MFSLIVLLLSLVSSYAAADTSALGEAFYVPKADLVGSMPSGVKVFKDIDEKCIETRTIDKTTRNEHFYKDTSSFYKSISSTTKLDASYQSNFALGVTLDATTKDISSNEREVSGSSLKLHSKKHKKIIQGNCLLEAHFIDDFKNDLEALEKDVEEPWQRESWRKYDGFMQKYGSHVISGIIYGSSIEQYIFAKSSNEYSQRDFTVQACAELAGPAGAGKVSVKACAGVDSSEIKKASSMDTSKSIVVTGGKAETRNKMEREDRSPDLIEQFLNEGSTDPGPIQILLTPVWRILQDYYSSKEEEHMEKAMNLEYYFNGFLNYDCKYIKKGKLELQRFEKSPQSKPGRPKFVCSIAPEGCHSDKDCHYKIGVWCSCNGDSCVKYNVPKSNTGKERKDPIINHESWGWHGCGWKLWGSRCGCTDEKTEREIVWSSSHLRDPIIRINKLRDRLKKVRPAPSTEESTADDDTDIQDEDN